MRVLVVEDNPSFRRLVASHLTKNGFVVDAVDTIDDALAALSTASFDIVLLDLMLPDGHGRGFIDALRQRGRRLPVIVISADGSLMERINLLELGADDYLVKPFDFDELIARIRAISRREASDRGNVEVKLIFADLLFHPNKRFVVINGLNVMLSAQEASLLEALLGRAGSPIERDHLMSCVYRHPHEIGSNSLAVHIHHLRQKLAAAGARVSINAVRGVGYSIEESRPAALPSRENAGEEWARQAS
jgi:DNA-binding response OmpR family regulator